MDEVLLKCINLFKTHALYFVLIYDQKCLPITRSPVLKNLLRIAVRMRPCTRELKRIMYIDHVIAINSDSTR